jgi:hypothetical protein
LFRHKNNVTLTTGNGCRILKFFKANIAGEHLDLGKRWRKGVVSIGCLYKERL